MPILFAVAAGVLFFALWQSWQDEAADEDSDEGLSEWEKRQKAKRLADERFARGGDYEIDPVANAPSIQIKWEEEEY